MAQLKLITKKNGKKYYYSIITSVKWDKSVIIPLHTHSKTEAELRHNKIEKKEKDIKAGREYTFPWQKPEGGRTTINIKTLQDAANDYLEYRTGKVRASTIRRDRISLNQLIQRIGPEMPISKLSHVEIEGSKGLIHLLQKEGYLSSGINITLRHIRTFTNWLYKKAEYINREILFDNLNEGKPLPRYLNESELKQIYSLDWLDDFFKRAFFFYETSGCRPIEPFIGELLGNWLIIEVEKSKGKSVRQIHLNEKQKQILEEMQQFRDQYSLEGSLNPSDTAYHRLATIMRKVTKALNFKGKRISLKSFRHTYGIKRVTISGDIHRVAREMGHCKTSTTEIYLQYPEQRRIDDFPSLKNFIEKEEKRRDLVISETIFSETCRWNFLNAPR